MREMARSPYGGKRASGDVGRRTAATSRQRHLLSVALTLCLTLSAISYINDIAYNAAVRTKTTLTLAQSILTLRNIVALSSVAWA